MASWKAALISVAILVGLSTASSAEDRAMRSEKMPFRECLALIDEVAGEFGTDAMRLQRTRDLHSARIQAADGIVTLVCSRTDQTVTLSRSTG
jgi:hypothetical protein